MLTVLLLVVFSIFPATFEEEKTETADGEDFLFPNDGKGSL